jgi:N-acetyl-anhydromuramyl-L-alanine amidase AmpD
MIIHDYTNLWPATKSTWRRLSKIDRLLIHRTWLPIGYPTPESFLAEYRRTDPGSAGFSTGGNKPYGFLIPPKGEIWQLAAMTERTAHARTFNRRSVGIALWGDFRSNKSQPTQPQSDALIWLCAALVAWRGLDERDVEGHTEQPGRSGDPAKVCPGPLLSLSTIRSCVKVRMAGMPKGVVPTGLVVDPPDPPLY